MANFYFLGKGLRKASLPDFEYDFSCNILLTYHISLPGCLYFLRYWKIRFFFLLRIFTITQKKYLNATVRITIT